jgi:D-arabinan exo alpha-(1,3)/(1,5)-arabinofuranosidase (non-reducing end)
MTLLRRLLACAAVALAGTASAQSLYQYQPQKTSWLSPENRNGEPGRGAMENHGAKGHAFDSIAAGGELELGRIDGAGVIRRIWMTVDDRSPRTLRALHLQMFWDGADTPAVDVPLGDFFGVALDPPKPFENALFASPEGRSFIAFVPMPFRKGARIVLRNEGDVPLKSLYYDVDFTREAVGADALYFHASWRRENPTTLGQDMRLLPKVSGRGRFLGASVAMISNPAYGETWWGEGEVKVFLDGDTDHPTLAGTGSEDYLGSGWGVGSYTQQYQGTPIADPKTRHWLFYRLHVPDPIMFTRQCEVRLQQIGSGPRKEVMALKKAGVPLQPVSLDRGGGREHFVKLLEDTQLDPAAANAPDGGLNYYRQDDVAATAYYYLDSPGQAPGTALAPVAARVAGASTRQQ